MPAYLSIAVGRSAHSARPIVVSDNMDLVLSVLRLLTGRVADADTPDTAPSTPAARPSRASRKQTAAVAGAVR